MTSFISHQILPNVRKFFVPDPGYTICDTDLDRADLQVVVWEADDDELKHALRAGVDLHILNGISLENLPLPPLDELVESHPNYPEHKARYKRQRQLAKSFIHGTNYGGSARTMAIAASCTVHQAELLQSRWFAAHPGIKEWHRRTERQLQTTRMVVNKFGYRRVYFDRIEGLLPEALAWVPQSTVALYINKIWDKVVTLEPAIQVLMQVHDSLVWQAPTQQFDLYKSRFKSIANSISIPYDDPLIIPVGFNASTISWGDCK
jgi:DNA polymerase I-like protein with 3'-5' exonuclease and polymerase domains